MKKTLILTLSVLAAICLTPSAFAFTDGFVDQPIPYDANASQALASSVGYTYYGSQKVMSTVPNTFCFIVGTKCWIGYKGEAGGRYATSVSESSGMNDSFQAIPDWYFNANWFYVNSDYAQYYYMPVFSSVDAAVAAAESLIVDNSNPVVSNFSVPAGWVAYFKTGSTVNLSCVQADYSMIGSNPWASNNQMYGYANSLPASGTTYPYSGMSYINWHKGSNLNIFGQTQNSVSSFSNGSVYTFVYNPLAQEGVGGSGTAADDSPNGTIVVSASNITEIRMYPLSGQFINTGDGYHFVSSSDDYENNYVDGVIDSETGTVVLEDSSGNVVIPNVGGQNSVPDLTSVSGFFSAIKQILVGIANDLGTIFGFAYEAVVTLVSTASAFVATLGSLYAWLPTPLSTVLISAITLAITIGVFKVFM